MLIEEMDEGCAGIAMPSIANEQRSEPLFSAEVNPIFSRIKVYSKVLLYYLQVLFSQVIIF